MSSGSTPGSPDEALHRALASTTGRIEPARHDLRWLEWRAQEVFGGIDVRGRRMLEIGAGSGLLCLWTAARGARRVVGLEPESAGAAAGAGSEARQLIDRSGLTNAEILPVTFQDWVGGESFDLIVSYNSINHLDEPACINLRTSEAARREYGRLFAKMRDTLTPGGELIVWDVSNRNLWPALGLNNPLDSQIEWRKHQSPAVWESLMREAGFGGFRVSWPPYYPLRRLGPLVRNPIASWCLGSRFRLYARRP